MAFFGIFGNKGIEDISLQELDKARTEYDLKVSISITKYENLGKKVRDILLESKGQNSILKKATAARYKAVKNDWITAGREVQIQSSYQNMISNLKFIKENYEQIGKGVIQTIMKDPKHGEKISNMALNVVDTDNTIQKFEETFEGASRLMDSGGSNVGELGEDLESLEREL